MGLGISHSCPVGQWLKIPTNVLVIIIIIAYQNKRSIRDATAQVLHTISLLFSLYALLHVTK